MKEKRVKRMKKRTLTGAVITLVVYLVVAFSHIPLVIHGAAAVLSAFAVYEIYHAAKLTDRRPLLIGAILAAMAVALLPIPGYTTLLTVVFPVALVVFGWMMARQDSCRLDSTMKAAGVALLVVLLFRAIPELRQVSHGLQYLAMGITLCFVTDVAAFLVGSRFGRRKLLPKVSPNKTVEGSVAGILVSVLVLIAWGWLLEGRDGYAVNWLLLCIYAVLVSVVGQFGDLSMSVVKRICGVKDFGTLFPGHGGMLDRFDSHMLSISFTLLFVTWTGGFL